MNLEDILNLQRLQCTGDISRAGWVVDQDEVLVAIDLLTITLPVHIRFSTAIYTHGTHRNKTNKAHHITLDQNRELYLANFTLWHELVHCMQAERYAQQTGLPLVNFHKEYRRQGSYGQAYEGNIYEQEANRLAAKHEHLLLLAYSP